jgi:hypothetical protein
MSGPAEKRIHVNALLEKYRDVLGESEEHRPGYWFYTARRSYRSGATVCYSPDEGDRNSEHCAVDLPGSVCRDLGVERLQYIVRKLLAMGFHGTRLDPCVRLDGGPQMFNQAVHAVQAGQMCGFRVWERIEKRRNGELIANGLNFGRRDGSKYLRFYDKGLERNEKAGQANPAGESWHLEAELKGDRAARFAEDFASAQGVDAIAELVSGVVIGCVDFRDGDRKTQRSRRNRLDWWADFVGEVEPVIYKVEPNTTNVITHAEWLRRCVVPTLKRLQDDLGLGVDQFVEEIGSDVPRAEGETAERLVFGYGRLLEQRVQESRTICVEPPEPE